LLALELQLNKLTILWLAAFPLMGSPGPATLSLAAMGSAYGVKKSMAYYCGIVLGTTGVLVLIATGLTGLLLAQPKLALLVTTSKRRSAHRRFMLGSCLR